MTFNSKSQEKVLAFRFQGWMFQLSFERLIDAQQNHMGNEIVKQSSSLRYNLTWDNYYRYDDVSITFR